MVKKLIALDDGHGMETPGKRTPLFEDGSFMHENEFNRTVLKYVKELLEYNGFDILEVAPTDADTPLKTRTDLASNKIKNKYNKPVDLYLSIHANAMTGQWGNARGVETFYWEGFKEGKQLADIMQKHLLKGTPQVSRGVKTANLHVLREMFKVGILSVLIEAAFMDNKEEAKLLLSDNYRKETAKELAMAVCEYYNIPFKDISQKQNIKISSGSDDKLELKHDWQWKMLEDTLHSLYKKGVLNSLDWVERVKSKELTVSELTWINTIILDRNIK